MQAIVDFIGANPWIWGVIALGFAVWVGALWLIFTSAKFRRKWLWILLSLVSFSLSWGVAPGVTVGVGIPIGALYVIWFWRYGRPPSAEQLAADAARRRAPPPTAPANRLIGLRVAYLMAAAATLILGWVVVSGKLFGEMMEFGAGKAHVSPSPEFLQMRDAITYGDGALVVVLFALFMFLVARPYWWGKLVCALLALPWCMFGLMSTLLGAERSTSMYVLSAGVLMLVAGVVAQVADPRFGGTYLRRAPG